MEQGVIKGSPLSNRDKMGDLEKEFRHHLDKGAMKISDSWRKLPSWIGAPPEF